MLYEELPRIESRALDGWASRLVPAVIVGAALTAALMLLLIGQQLFAAAAVFAGFACATFVYLKSPKELPAAEPLVVGPDYTLVGSALSLSREPVALTTGTGSLLIVNPAYRERFGGTCPPLELGSGDEAGEGLQLAKSMALRDGAGCVAGIATRAGTYPVEVERVGSQGDLLLWRFPDASPADPLSTAARRIRGAIGERLAESGVLAAVVDAKGKVLAANQSFTQRALGADQLKGSPRFSGLVQIGDDKRVRFVSEGELAEPLRVIHLPADSEGEGGAGTFLMFETASAAGAPNSSNFQALLDVLPIGLALVDRDGRFLTMNEAFGRAAGIAGAAMPVYPGDLVVKEDKGPVADAIRRNARGPAMSGDLAVRLNGQASEPVALTIAGLRGLGEAAVLLLLKDNSEEAKLKRQVAQATKMQVVGQLAGGVAHDFNNILTAIIGHCDLMLMRHTPGDSDYDDIQQIKSNSNRAAGLTRQLLAFSRQQTLRPQVLQLPDVVSEVSHLLKRLLSETVELIVKHGRNLGPVRADPGQLEQVIINLAVNARDAMQSKGGGTLTIQTYSVKADQVAELGSDILPIADYSALSVTDTGTGIPPNVLGKIFEPFFTTKEVGKGTGLGLSTVYGIVKQSGGFIFADSKLGEGTRFVIYLPVHREEAGAAKTRKIEKGKQSELWGSGTVLVVEDEPMVRSVAERALTRHGYTVITADNGEEALEILGSG